MKRFLGVVLAAAIGAGGISPAAAKSGQEAGKKERKVCKSYAKTSSRIGVDRVCKTQSEWDADAVRDAVAMDKFKTENTGRPLVTEPGSRPTRRN